MQIIVVLSYKPVPLKQPSKNKDVVRQYFALVRN